MASASPLPSPAPFHRSTAAPRWSLGEVWAYRELLLSLVERQLKAKYQRSLLGFVWTLLNPLLMLGVLTLVFSSVMRMPMERYWAFLISGFFAWNYTAQMLSSSTYVLLENAQLTRSVAFPAEVPLLAAAIARLVEFIIEMALVVLVLVVGHFGYPPSSLLCVPVLVLLQVLLAVGITMPIAAASLFFKDISHAIPAVLTLLFYLTPVFYPMSFVPSWVGWGLWCNPLAWLLTAYQQVLYEGRWPSWEVMGGLVAMTLVILPVGYGIFARYKRMCAELI